MHAYDFDKGYIQLVNSYLAFNKRYRGLYSEKQEEFLKAYSNNGSGLSEQLKDAFDSIKNEQNKAVPQETARNMWAKLRGYYKEIWLYETKNIKQAIPIGNIRSRVKMCLNSLVYRQAANLYFSDGYLNKRKTERIIKDWEKFIK